MEPVKFALRRKIMRDPFFYRAYFSIRLAKNTHLRLPSTLDDLYVDGYPRSGNTYLASLIRHFFPEFKFTSHLHVPAAIDVALKKSIPPVLLIRKPADAIASNIYRKRHVEKTHVDERLARMLIDDYISYYRFALGRADFVLFLIFTELKSDPLRALKSVLNCARCNDVAVIPNDDSLASFRESFTKRERQKATGSTSLPDSDSGEEKLRYSELVASQSSFADAAELYERILTIARGS